MDVLLISMVLLNLFHHVMSCISWLLLLLRMLALPASLAAFMLSSSCYSHICAGLAPKNLQHGSSNDFRSANFIEIFIDGLMAKEEWKPLDSLKSIWSLFADFADWGSAKDGMKGRERHFRELTTDFAWLCFLTTMGLWFTDLLVAQDASDPEVRDKIEKVYWLASDSCVTLVTLMLWNAMSIYDESYMYMFVRYDVNVLSRNMQAKQA